MYFLALSIIDIQFNDGSFTWRLYNIVEALSTTRQVRLIDK